MVFAVLPLIITLAAIAIALLAKPKNANKMKPLGLNDLQTTTANEGAVIPWIFGTVKIACNLIWYGNLEAVEVKVKTPGKAMGGGGGSQSSYKYYLDMHQAVGWSPHGGMSILDVYVADKSSGLSALGNYTFYKGDELTYPTQPGIYSNRLKGVAHLFLDRFDLGEGGFVPNIVLVVKNTSPCPLTYANMAEGINPAAVIWDILIASGIDVSRLNTASFQAAATYWYGLSYGINLALTSQEFIDETIAQIQTYVDFDLYQDANCDYFLKPYKSTDASVATLDTDDFKTFSFVRQSWDSTANDFRATFTDEDQDYTSRVVAVDNVASISLIGHRIQKSIKLDAFTSVDIASKRLAEIMKQSSYPASQITCDVPYRLITLKIGDIVTINHSDYGLINGLYRVLNIEESDSNNSIKLTLNQQVEVLFNGAYPLGGGSEWIPSSTLPGTLSHEELFELPFTESYGTTPTFLCLGQRKTVETGYAIYEATSPLGDYSFVKKITSFATHAVLAETYSVGYSLDDDIGILLIPHRFDPEWVTIDRMDLFATQRVLICGTEIMTFESIVPEGVNAYRLKGILRGVLGTPISSHTISSPIWIAEISDNSILSANSSVNHYYKFVPYTNAAKVNITSCATLTTTYIQKALTPLSVGRVVATRTSATNVDVILSPRVYNTSGRGSSAMVVSGNGINQNSAGARSEDLQSDIYPPDTYGIVEYKVNAGGTWAAPASITGEFSFSYNPGTGSSHSLYIRYNWNGLLGLEKITTVGASNIEYFGPDN